MDRSDELAQEVEALRDRLSGLSEASRRINESVDFETVLQGILGCARAITGARCAGITTVDGSGQPQDFFTSGMSPEERQWIEDFPEGPAFFAHLSGLAEPLRTGDFSELHQVAGPSRIPITHSGVLPSGDVAAQSGRGGRQLSTLLMAKGVRSSPSKTRRPWSCSPPRRP